MPKTVCQSVAWFKRYKTLKSVTVGSLNLRKFSYSARTRSAFGLARNHSLTKIDMKRPAGFETVVTAVFPTALDEVTGVTSSGSCAKLGLVERLC